MPRPSPPPVGSTPGAGRASPRGRVVADGSHLELDGRSFRVKGVTYGSFARRPDGAPFPVASRMAADLAAIAALGLNTVRTYDLPPPELLDVAAELGLRLLVGLAYHDWLVETAPGRAARRRILDAGRREVDRAMARCAGRSEVLAVAVGNEVPADVLRLHGVEAVQDILATLVEAVHEADHEMLATYCNFPTTEFLDVAGADLTCFNVFLEEERQLRRYLRHLQVVTQGRPLLITELGLSAGAHGESKQARELEWQLRTVDESGCAGATVFSWTDEWVVGDHRVTGWDFGLTHEDRRPKPALEVVGTWATRSIREARSAWPTVSVIVCAYNEERTISDCLASLQACEYPNLEVLVCDDGSTDRTLEIARGFPFRILALPHGGLSTARNHGIRAATGTVIAFLDADAACHREWPFHLVLSLEEDGVAASGGPNLPVDRAGLVERAVAAAPGNPTHVLLSDDRAEHVPGCNMAYRAVDLRELGGFNPLFTAAGDDVDVCWKLLDRGRDIAFSAAAQVRHHRRRTVRGYLRQQRGYGRAEALLAGTHPHRFNRFGQARWRGCIYGGAGVLPRILRPIVYHGSMGTAPFQPVVRRRAEILAGWLGALLPLIAAGGVSGLVLAALHPLAVALPVAAGALILAYAVEMARQAHLPHEPRPFVCRLLVGLLHVAQPFVRGWGRLTTRRPLGPPPSPTPWRGDRGAWLGELERALRGYGCSTRAGGLHDRWDLEAAVGPLVACRMTTAVVWQWEPRWRLGYRPRPTTAFVVLVVAVGAAMAPLAAGAVAAALGLTAAREGARLRARVVAALGATTASASHTAPDPE